MACKDEEQCQDYETRYASALDRTLNGIAGKEVHQIGLRMVQQERKVLIKNIRKISSVQLLIRVQLFATLWSAACQASLSITNSQSLFKLMSIELVMPSKHLILCRPLLLLPSIFPSIRVFSNESVFASGGQSTGVSKYQSFIFMLALRKPGTNNSNNQFFFFLILGNQ